MFEEVWKDVPRYDGLYQVSNIGSVRNKKTGRILKPQLDPYGYYMVQLSKDGKVRNNAVHRLVYEAFNGPIPEGMTVNHIDEDKTRNVPENLNLMTRKENNNWGTRTKRASATQSRKVRQLDLAGNLVKTWPSLREIERQTGYSRGSISDCCNGKHKQAYGFVWRYENNCLYL